MNTDRLRDVIDSSGITITALSGKLGMSRTALYRKLETGDFKISDAREIAKTFRLTNEELVDIFFN